MSSEWPIVTLREFVDLLAGFAFKSAGYSEAENSVRLLRGDNIGQRVIRWEDAKRWPSGDLANLVRYALRVGDVVLAMDRPWIPAGLKVARVTESDTPSYLVQRVSRLRTKSSGDDNFLYALLSSPAFSAYIQNSTTGTAVPHISAKQILDYEFNLPPENTRAEIGQIVAFLDNRITLLRETNTTLEAIAQALFKSWFVDFDPVHAKQQGRAPEGMDAQTAALFPDSFEESELGMVPKGWGYSTVGQSFILTMGQSPPGDTYNGNGEGLPFYQGRTDFGFRFPSQRIFCSAPTRFAENGDTLVSVRAPVGDVNMALERCCIGRGVASVRHSLGYNGFAFYAMRSLGERFKTFDSEGTVFGSINKKDFQNLPFIETPEKFLRVYDSITSSVDTQIVNNELMVRSLSALRDTLLPRLISGQLRLPEAQALVEDAVDA